MCMRVQHINTRMYCWMLPHLYKHTREKEERGKSTTERPTNLKRGRSERVSWEEAEEKSTVTVSLLQRTDKWQQL